MQCKNIQNVLPHFAKDELPEADREKLAVHLRSCAACSKVAAEYARLAELTENLPAVTPPVRILDELKQNVRRQISANKETGKQTNRRFAGLLPLFHKPHFAYAWGGALVVLLAVAIWIGSDWHAKPERRTL
ncbi:MAG: anti-sigma factor family protein, partial [bacterium]